MKREQAARAIALGYRRDTLIALNGIMRCGEVGGDFVADWAFQCHPDPSCGQRTPRLIYRSYSPADVERAFSTTNTTDEVVAYCDGSGTQSEKAAGIGVVIYRPDALPEFIAENIGTGTNNRAELCAVWRALRGMSDTTQPLVILTDSEYTIGALTKDWARNANVELITNIRTDLALRPHVRFEHVDGHSGVEGNEIADKLSNIGRKLVKAVSFYEG